MECENHRTLFYHFVSFETTSTKPVQLYRHFPLVGSLTVFQASDSFSELFALDLFQVEGKAVC